MKLDGKIALITGASEGIGRALAGELARHGVRCVAVSRNAEARPFDNDLVIARNCDVSKPQEVRELLLWIDETYGSLDIIINNAGIWHKVGQLETIEDDKIAQVVQTNLLGTIYPTKCALPLLRRANEAAIVNVVSKSGVLAQAGQSVYTASKYGAKGFTDVLREDLKGTSIHILGVYQSGTNTKMFAKAGEEFGTDTFTEPTDLAQYITSILASPPKFWVKELHVDRR